MKPILILFAALLLTGCANMKLGTMLYVPHGQEAALSVSPFRGADRVPGVAEGKAAAVAVPVVSPASAVR